MTDSRRKSKRRRVTEGKRAEASSRSTPAERALRKLAEIHINYYPYILVLMTTITFLMILSIPSVNMETDIVKLLPSNIESVKLELAVRDVFGTADKVFILVSLDENCAATSTPKEITSPAIIRFLIDASEKLSHEPNVRSVVSIALPFTSMGYVPADEGMIKSIIEKAGLDSLISKDRRSTVMLIDMDVGSSEESIKRNTDRIRQIMESVERPACLKYTITGMPPMRRKLFELMLHDMAYTLGLAIIIIFVLLVFLRRSLKDAVLIFIPLTMGVAWTAGIFGWMGWKLTMATVGVGAMVVGLGVEYGVFMVERYREEVERGSTPPDAIRNALPSVGSSITGSGMTTIAGFLALLSTAFPMLESLGIALALGIGCMLFITIFFMPSLLLMESTIVRFRRGRE